MRARAKVVGSRRATLAEVHVVEVWLAAALKVAHLYLSVHLLLVVGLRKSLVESVSHVFRGRGDRYHCRVERSELLILWRISCSRRGHSQGSRLTGLCRRC